MLNNKLQERFDEIERIVRGMGLNPFDVHFFEVPSSYIWQVAAYGLPTRYSHWSHGMLYDYHRTHGEMGFSKIYELILNCSPSLAFLDKSNSDTINLLICAHCLSHSDFFCNNILFKKHNEYGMIEVAKHHADLIDKYRKDYGEDEVDHWIDIAISLERHIDWNKGLYRDKYPNRKVEFEERSKTEWEDFVYGMNKEPLMKKVIKGAHIPPHPERDILWFLSEYANLEEWQRNVFWIVRRESYYFYPQYRTKYANEGWACLAENSLVLTTSGLTSIKEIVERQQYRIGIANGNSKVENPSDFHITEPQKTVIVTTNKGITIEGAESHRLLATTSTDGILQDTNLKDIKVGDFILLDCGTNLWAEKEFEIEFVYTHGGKAKQITIPRTVNGEFAEFLGYFISEGYTTSRAISIVNKDRDIIERCKCLVKNIFGFEPAVHSRKDDPDKYDVIVYSAAVINLLEYLEIDLGAKSRKKSIPNVILKSPKHVVSRFLAALYEGDGGCYESSTIVLSSGSKNIISQTAMLLLNFGINFSFQCCKKKGYEDTFQLRVGSLKHLKKFVEDIPFSVHKQKIDCCNRILKREYKCNRKEKDAFYAKVTNISNGFDILYDMTIPKSHHYVAQGAINHNSMIHAETMRQYAMGDDNDYNVKGIKYPLTSEEHLDFAAAHEKVVRPGIKVKMKIDRLVIDPKTNKPTKAKEWNPNIIADPNIFRHATSLNPYYVGFMIFMDIKKRWDKYCEQGYMEDKLGRKIPVTINGMQKCLEVRESEDDVSLFRNYLTDELREKLHLFSFGNIDSYDDSYDLQELIKEREKEYGSDNLGQASIDKQIIVNKTVGVLDKETKKIIDAFARSRNNYGVPEIVIRRVSCDSTLRLEHLEDDPINLDIFQCEYMLKYLYKVWNRPVEIIRKDQSKKCTWVYRYNGSSVSLDRETLDYIEVLESMEGASSY